MYKNYILSKYNIKAVQLQAYATIDAMEEFLNCIEGEQWVLKGAMCLFLKHDYIRESGLTKDIDISLLKQSPKSFVDAFVAKEKIESGKYVFEVIKINEMNSSTIYKGSTITIKATVKGIAMTIPFSMGIAVEEMTNLQGINTKEIKFYSTERILADKYVSMIQIGSRNSRKKDFQDVKALFDTCNKKLLFSLIKELIIKRRVDDESINSFTTSWKEFRYIVELKLEQEISTINDNVLTK